MIYKSGKFSANDDTEIKTANDVIKEGAVISLEITDMTDDGKGLGHVSGLTIFVLGAVAGDKVKAEISKVKKRYAIAKCIEFIELSADRVNPTCPYYGDCGGCAMLELNYGAQVDIKRKNIATKLKRIGGITAPVVNEVIRADDNNRYRNKAEFAVAMTKNGPIVGFNKRGSNMIIDCEDCLLQKSSTMAVAGAIRRLLKDRILTVFDSKKNKGFLRRVTVKACEGSGEMMVILTSTNKIMPNAEKVVYAISDAIDALEESTENLTLADKNADDLESVNFNKNEAAANLANTDKDKNEIKEAQEKICYFLESVVVEVNKSKDLRDPATSYEVIAGTRTITDITQEGLKFEISAPAFYQVNTRQMHKLYEKVREYADLNGGETLFDLYCGIGTIGLSMAEDAGMIIGIESVKNAVLDANRNAVINGIVNARYYLGKAEQIMPRLLDKDDKLFVDYIDESAPKIAILDPPRAGCDEELLRTIAKCGIERIVYVSCDPGTLSRDIKLLATLGYEFKETTPVDMFVNTMHVETIALIQRVKS